MSRENRCGRKEAKRRQGYEESGSLKHDTTWDSTMVVFSDGQEENLTFSGAKEAEEFSFSIWL